MAVADIVNLKQNIVISAKGIANEDYSRNLHQYKCANDAFGK